MSSEEERAARKAIIADVCDIQAHAFENGRQRLLLPDRPLRLDRTAKLLTNYRTAIERRVLAQQSLPLEIVRIYGRLSDYEDQGIFLCGPGHPLWESTLRELCQTIRKEFGPLMGSDLMSMRIAAQPQETSG